MKKFVNLFLVCVFIFTTSCSKEESLETLDNQTFTFEAFFDKVSAMDIQTSKENVIFVNYTWNKKDNTITITDAQEKEASWGVALEVASLKNNDDFQKRDKSDKKYQVSCSNGDNSWTKSCSGKWSCGSAIADCLEQGGCAEVCKLALEYYVPEKLFFLNAKNLDGLDVIAPSN